MDTIGLGRLGRALGARVEGDPDLPIGPDVVIDSRLATPGSLFVALPGENVDGHDFIDAARANGAAAALVSRVTGDAGIARLLVKSPAQSLADLARGTLRGHITRGLEIVGVTGSSGKTSTKDLIAQVLEAAGPTVAPAGSQNNELGVPLTALKVTHQTKYLVAEMGARGKGHIEWLCRIVPPRVGVVLNVGSAHVGEFGSTAAIALAKGELVEALPAQGWAVLNADDPLVNDMAARTAARIARFSVEGEPLADLSVWATDITADDEQRHSFTLHVGAEDTVGRRVRLGVVGPHQVPNALAAATVGAVLGLDAALIATAIGNAVTRSNWRMAVHVRKDKVTVVNDAYNANPDSMQVALTTAGGLLTARRRTYPKAKLVAVLGDMLELGDSSSTEHMGIGRAAAQAGASVLVAVGGFADDLVAGALAGGVDAHAVASRDDVAGLVPALAPGDVVIVKASRGVGLEVVADALIEGGTR